MKRFVLAIALLCALSGRALAGEIHTAGVTSTQSDTTQAGEMPTCGVTSPPDTTNPVATILLAILSAVV